MSVRYVVFGAGAIGGVVGARLHQAGHEVVLLARGAHLDAIRTRGLRLLTPVEDVTLEIPAAADPAELDVGRDGDVVLLAVKSQDTLGALDQLRIAGAGAVPIVCLQNGVENERVALRRFPDVYGAVVIAPTNHLQAGVVEASGAKLSGIIDLGRYPRGTDGRAEAVAADLRTARIDSRAVVGVMGLKYGKLLMNLRNVVGALFAEDDVRAELSERVQDEGRAVLSAAGIDRDDAGAAELETRRAGLEVGPIAGRARAGSSTWQSLARGSASHPPTIETDFLNGEICLLGRQHGVDTPLNDALCELAFSHVARGGGPGELSAELVASAGV